MARNISFCTVKNKKGIKMKNKAILILAMLVFVAVCFGYEGIYTLNKAGSKVEPGQVHTLQDEWQSQTAFTASATTPTSTNRTAALFLSSDANNVSYGIDTKWNVVRIRCSSTTDGDTSVFDVFLMNGDNDHYNRVATLTFTTGGQTATTSGHEYADTLVESNANWHKTASTMSPTGNYIAEWAVDICGSKKIGICPTTITNAAVLEITGF